MKAIAYCKQGKNQVVSVILDFLQAARHKNAMGSDQWNNSIRGMFFWHAESDARQKVNLCVHYVQNAYFV